jgi:hypothetical protein
LSGIFARATVKWSAGAGAFAKTAVGKENANIKSRIITENDFLNLFIKSPPWVQYNTFSQNVQYNKRQARRPAF